MPSAHPLRTQREPARWSATATSTSTGPSTSPKNTAAFTRHATPSASSPHPH